MFDFEDSKTQMDALGVGGEQEGGKVTFPVITDGLEKPLGQLLGYRTDDMDFAKDSIEDLARALADDRINCGALRRKVLESSGFKWDVDIAIRRLFDVVCRGKRDDYVPDSNQLKTISNTENPSRTGSIRRHSKFAARKVVGNAFQLILARPENGFEGRYDVDEEIRRRLHQPPNVPILMADPAVREMKEQIQRERKQSLIEKCRLNAKKFIERAIAVKVETDADWLTPGALLEHYSDGLFGTLEVRPGFIDDNSWMYVEVNDVFLQALPLEPWAPPLLTRFPDRRRGGHLKKGHCRFHIIEFLGAAVASRYCLGDASPWLRFYDHLDAMFIALRHQGHNILLPEGPLDTSDFHGHNFLAGIEEIALAAKEINRDALFRPWYWRKPPSWWGKNWCQEWRERHGMLY